MPVARLPRPRPIGDIAKLVVLPVLHDRYGWPLYLKPAPYDHCDPTTRIVIRRTMRQIINEVCAKHHISVTEIRSHRRHREVVIARQEAMYRCKEETGCSLPQIGRALGGKDHTTVIHGIKKHAERMAEVALED